MVIGVLASGRGSNLQAILDAIRLGTLVAKVGIVISDKKDAMALARARSSNVPGVFLDPKAYPGREAYDAALVSLLATHKVELVVLAGFMRVVTRALIEPYKNRIINIHPSLLPAFPGLHAQRQALAHGVKISGCTVHFVDEQVDHGPIIAQVASPVEPEDTESSLSDRILAEEHRLLPQVIQQFAEGKLGRLPV